MTGSILFGSASKGEESEIRGLLIASGLPVEDIAININDFISARINDRVIACIGLERSEKIGLLRSLAVAADFREKGIAWELCTRLERSAKEAGVQDLYLLTTTASGFFSKRGYQQVDRQSAPLAIQRNKQFTTLCPSSAILMKKTL
jgi:amino-acid N-acetyltransferase